MISLLCISLNHKNASIDIRKQFAFSETEAKSFCASLCDKSGGTFVNGAVLVSTCNRFELYVSLPKNAGADAKTVPNLQERIAKAKEKDVRILRKYSHSFIGKDALKHLFSVAAGLDSMILGENQILGQLREAYKTAFNAGQTDFLLNTVFQRALSAAKRIKTETNLSKTTESIATLAVKQILSFSQNKPITALVIGASGQTGSLVVRDLAERAEIQVLATVRHHYPLPELNQVTKIAYDERYDFFEQSDVVVSATRSPHCTVSYEDTMKAIKSQKPRLFIDLAVPNDIDSALSNEENFTLKNIDCFTAIAKEHNLQKKEGTLKAADILNEELDSTVKELFFHSKIDFVKDFGLKIKNKSGMQFLYEMRRMATADELAVLMGIWHRMNENLHESEE